MTTIKQYSGCQLELNLSSLPYFIDIQSMM